MALSVEHLNGFRALLQQVSQNLSQCQRCHAALSDKPCVSIDKCHHIMHGACLESILKQDQQARCPTCWGNITGTHNVTAIEAGEYQVSSGTFKKYLEILKPETFEKIANGTTEEKAQLESQLTQLLQLVGKLSIDSLRHAEEAQQAASASAATSSSASGSSSGTAGSH